MTEIERCLAERPHLDARGRSTLRAMLQRLEQQAKPGNWAENKLVNEFGYVSDTMVGDMGDYQEYI